jgi:hypothetical protein
MRSTDTGRNQSRRIFLGQKESALGKENRSPEGDKRCGRRLLKLKRKRKGIAIMNYEKKTVLIMRNQPIVTYVNLVFMKGLVFVTRTINAQIKERSHTNLPPTPICGGDNVGSLSVIHYLARPNKQDFNGNLFLRVRI